MKSKFQLESGVQTIRDLIESRAQIHGEEIFLIGAETGRSLTFQGLQKQARLLFSQLRGLGLEPGDKVAFLMDNGLFTAQLFLGAIYGGFIAVPLNVRAGVSQLSFTLDHCDADVVFVEEKYTALIKEVMGGISRSIRVIPADVDNLVQESGTETAVTLPVCAPGDVALLMYTSGSTGQPKAAIHTHRTILAGAQNSVVSHKLTAADRSLLVLPLYHINAECVTLIPTLLSGGSVVVTHHFVVGQFWDLIDEHRCTWSALVPTIISQLLDWKDPRADRREAAFKRIRFLRSSSAPLSPSLHREFLDKFKLPLIQAMGSTEAGNIFSNPVPPGKNKIGSPGLPWGFEARIVNREGAEVPQGEAGEVLLRGPAMTQGYYKDPATTAAAFDADGWLHTGDLAYRDEDGYFFVVGRSKELIIKGGMNIAPKQIDEVLESHPAVLEAAVVGVPDRYVGEDLVAFAVLREGMNCDERELLGFCENRLGQFKTPTRVHFVKDLPKGPSGKVQRLRLVEEAAKPEAAGESGRAAQNGFPPADLAVEQIITQVWSDLLKKEKVDEQNNFFELGGHSLLAIQCLSRLREKIPVILSLADFFRNPTVAQQAALVRERLLSSPTRQVTNNGANPADSKPIPPRDRSLPCPLSPAQERLWFLEQLNPGVPLYNEAEAVLLEGKFDVEVMEKALNVIVARHEILRSTIQVVDEKPAAIFHESRPLKVKRIDLRDLPAEQRRTEVERLLVEEPRRPYRLETETGIRATVVQLADEEHVFFLMMHHIICDRLSLGILWRELGTVYEALSQGQPFQLPPLPIQYGDYATWQRRQIQEGNFEKDLSFWKENLRGAPELLDLPLDRPRPPIVSYRGLKRRFQLGRALAKKMRELGRREKTSLFNVFAAAWNMLLSRYTGQDDILVGIPIADRDRPELQPLIGFFIDTQVLRTSLADNPTFQELLARVQLGVVDVYSHKALPFAQVVDAVKPERNLSYSPLFQVMLNWRDRDAQLQFIGLPHLAVKPLLAQSNTSKFDLTVFLTDAVEDIWLEVEYSSDLFNNDRIERMVGHLRTLLEGAVLNPEQRLSDLPLLTEPERHQLLRKWNDTQTEYPRDKCFHELFQAQADATPEAVAVEFENQRLSYGELNARANQLARHLQKLGVGPDTLVGICVERSLEMVVGLLGILKAGGAYVPLDPSYPGDRIAFMLENSAVPVLLTQEHLAEKMPAPQARVVRLDADWAKIAVETDSNFSNGVTPQHLAYVIYTSGSTGKPKGVQIPHGALVNFLDSMRQAPGLTVQDTLLAITTLSFDIAGLELWLPLLVGARVVLASRETAQDSRALAELLDRCGATVLQATPSTYRLLLAGGWKGHSRLKILCGGEPWPGELAQQLLKKCESLWNMYGPTETTIWSAVSRIEPDEEVLIGGPIANTQLYVVDRYLQPVPLGVPGELCIGGDGLARGYLNRPELTAEKFSADPFSDKPGARIYRTGDLVRLRPDGKIEFLGRLDHQVKMRGHRIELGEIETTLNQYPAVKTAAVVIHEDGTGDKRLVAYVVPNYEYKEADDAKAHDQHVSDWQSLWDTTYGGSDGSLEDPLNNTIGWRSSYDGQPIPQEEMREWVDNTVKRILSLEPKRVLELGCGSGLLLFGIIPHCSHYCGVDISPTALAYIRRQLETRPEYQAKVTLLQRQADELDDLKTEDFDAVILNSVAQYFPNIDYLVHVLERASRTVKPGGFLFLGDVRNLHLLKAFCASIQLQQAPGELTVDELRRRIHKQMDQEEELLIAPEFFLAIKQHLPGVSAVEIQLKRGHYSNEMTLFRYDVVLRMGPPAGENESPDLLDWEKNQLTPSTLRNHLEQTGPRALQVKNIPNARLQRELDLMELLADQNQIGTVSKLRKLIGEKSASPGIAPEDIWKLDEVLPYSVRITCADPSNAGSFDAIFIRKEAGQERDGQVQGNDLATESAKVWSSYANNPLEASRARKLIPTLRHYLKGKLPEYMVPADYVTLDAMPLTPNGKLNRKALPAPNFGRSQPSFNFAAPHSAMEQLLTGIWTRELGLEKVSVNDNFFDLGGHSLLLIRVQAKLGEALKTNVSIVELFQYPTVRSLAQHLAKTSTQPGRLPKIQERAGRRAEALVRRRQKRVTQS